MISRFVLQNAAAPTSSVTVAYCVKTQTVANYDVFCDRMLS